MHTFMFSRRRLDGFFRELPVFIKQINGEGLIWSILDYDGFGLAPKDMSMQEFGNQIYEREQGYLLSWSELLEFSSKQDTCHECMIVAVKNDADINKQKIFNGDFESLIFVIENFDSTFWRIITPENYNIKDEMGNDPDYKLWGHNTK
jgi:hypothetical protein